MSARVPASRCTSAHVANFPERFAGAPGELLGRVLNAQSADALESMRGELAVIAAGRGTAIASHVIGQAIEARAKRLRLVAARAA